MKNGACKHVPRQTIPDDRCHPPACAFECSPPLRSELRFTCAPSGFRPLVTLAIDLGRSIAGLIVRVAERESANPTQSSVSRVPAMLQPPPTEIGFDAR